MAGRGHADRFAALADPTRRQLLEGLAVADRTVSELTTGLDMSQAAVSQHLRILREAGLVTAQRDGRRRRYRLLPSGLTELRDWLDELDRFWRGRLAALGDYLDAGSVPGDVDAGGVPVAVDAGDCLDAGRVPGGRVPGGGPDPAGPDATGRGEAPG